MAFAQAMSGANHSVGSLFAYLAGTFVVLCAVVVLTPERLRRIVADLTGRS